VIVGLMPEVKSAILSTIMMGARHAPIFNNNPAETKLLSNFDITESFRN
jgi:hypothetical protein